MKIWIGNKFIHSAYFRTWCLNEEFALVYFIYQPKNAYEGEFSLPLLFSSPEEAKRFYDETWNGIADGADAVWCLDEKATFSWKLYFKIHALKSKERSARKINKKKPHEDNNQAGNPQDGVVQGGDAPRKGWFNSLLLRLPIRRGRRVRGGVPDSGADVVQ